MFMRKEGRLCRATFHSWMRQVSNIPSRKDILDWVSAVDEYQYWHTICRRPQQGCIGLVNVRYMFRSYKPSSDIKIHDFNIQK